AQRVAAEGGAAPAQTQEPVFVSRERTQQALNPEISITGDVVGFGRIGRNGRSGELTAIPREFEFSFQTAIDPYARMKIFVAREEEVPFEIEEDSAAEEEHGGFEIEEAYAYWVGLPGGLGLDVGKFQQQAGILNRWHTHAWPEADFPLALREILGHEGLAQTGASVYWLAPWSGGGSAYELWLQATAASNDRLFPESNAPTALAHLNNYWDLSDATYVQIGFTGAYAQDEDADDLRTRLAGVDLTLNWRPPARALYRELTLRSEWLWTDQRTATGGESSAWGGYVAGYYKLGPRWRAGLRYDLLDPAEPGAERQWQIAPTLTRWWTEFLRLRAQWNHWQAGDERDDQFLLQLVWAVGPHREDAY
ncbi:MAG: hypothetical protein ACREKI_03785, partial [Gemmatimonadota bacterium]